MGFKPLSNDPCPTYYALQVTKANEFIKKMEELQQFLTNKIIWAQSVYKTAANKNQTPVPAY